MSLTLKVISPSNMPPGQLPEFTFDELGGSIGRKPNNDFVLIDPERFISSQHANIEFQGGKFLIIDTSTNGVFINNSKRPIGTGNSQEISDGDKISIGEFQLEAILSNVPQQAAPNLMASPPMPGPASADIFDFSEPLIQDNSASGGLDAMDPLALLDGGSIGLSTGEGQNTGQNNGLAGGFSPNSSTANPMGLNLGADNFQSHDILQQDNQLGSSGADITSNGFFDDIIDNPHQNIPEPLPMNEPFTPPSAIPDDWDIMGDDLGGPTANADPLFQPTPDNAFTSASPSQQPVQNSGFNSLHNSHHNPDHNKDGQFPDTQFESTTPLIPDTETLFDDDDIFASLSATAQPVQATPQTAHTPAPENISPPPSGQVPQQNTPYQTPQYAPQPDVSIPAPMQMSPAAQAQRTTSNNRELLDAFIRGAGLDPSQVKTDNPVELLTKLGQLTRISTEGLMMALRARATIKSSFRVNKTIIAPIENNPLKFSVTSEDALNIIFADEKTGYMSPTEAFSEGFKDLQTHQMAMMAGMQAIIKEITTQFSPETLERKFDQKKSSSNFMPGNKKAKNWEMYEIFYKKMTETLQDDFQNVYGEEFARAYENQVRKLI